MSKVGSKETEPEILVRRYLHSKGFRFRKNDKRYPGAPDIVLPKYNTIVFVNGCFWHGHNNCHLARRPSTHERYWHKKLDENIERDKKNTKELRKRGWNVITIWQCQINTITKRERIFPKIFSNIIHEHTINYTS